MLSWLKLLTLGIRIIVNVISYKVSDRTTCLPLISPKIWCLLGECLDARLGVQAAVCLGLNVIKRFSCQNSPTKNSSRIQSQETRIFSERKKCNQIWWPAGILPPSPSPCALCRPSLLSLSSGTHVGTSPSIGYTVDWVCWTIIEKEGLANERTDLEKLNQSRAAKGRNRSSLLDCINELKRLDHLAAQWLYNNTTVETGFEPNWDKLLKINAVNFI